MKFYADAMLGKLARYLRMLGYDTLYKNSKKSRKKFFDIAADEKRIIISRSREIINKAKKEEIKAIYLNNTDIVTILKTLQCEFNIKFKLNPDKARCSLCNGVIEKMSKEKIRDHIPEGTYKNHNNFWKCVECNQFYWVGSHWEDIRNKIKLIRSGD